MACATSTEAAGAGPGRAVRFSYLFMVGMLLLLVWLRLATPLLAALFTYLALEKLNVFKRAGRWLAVVIFLVLLAGASYALGHFTRQTVHALPEIADKSIPSILEWAKRYQIELPFNDYASLREAAMETVTSEMHYLSSFAKFARAASHQLVFLIVGCVVALSVFLFPAFELRPDPEAPPHNLYGACCGEIGRRFTTLYRSFTTVMGAQIIISAINTVITCVFAFAVDLPYPVVVVGVTFLCGLLPVVGNLISNTIIVCIGFTVSPQVALIALAFLVVIHKLEYFLNSKIVGWRISNPLWLTLLGLIIGERLMGVPGMILAPVMLYYIRLEASPIQVSANK